jgi:hypothetical protein
MGNGMIAILAYILVLGLYVFLASLAIVYTYIKAIIIGIKKRSYKAYSQTMWQWVYKAAWGLDQAGSPLLKHLGNDLMFKPDAKRMGSPDVTISHYLGYNKVNNKSYWLGLFFAYLVDLVALFFGDVNHTEKAAKAEQFNEL